MLCRKSMVPMRVGYATRSPRGGARQVALGRNPIRLVSHNKHLLKYLHSFRLSYLILNLSVNYETLARTLLKDPESPNQVNH